VHFSSVRCVCNYSFRAYALMILLLWFMLGAPCYSLSVPSTFTVVGSRSWPAKIAKKK
jgi:hypothetical protein